MSTILLFHHVQGLTPGVLDFADTLRAAGHTVHTPDLLEGQKFASIAAGVDHVRGIGFSTIIERGKAAAQAHPDADIFIGMSLGVMPAQYLAQTRPGVRAAVLLHGAVPVSEFSPHWPKAVAVQIHAMDADPEFIDSGDIEAARALVAEAGDGELFLYPGDGHLFTDSSLPDYEAAATSQLLGRLQDFLARL